MDTQGRFHSGRYERYQFDESVERQIRKLYERDNWHGPLAILEDYAIMALCVAACYLVSWWLYPVAVLVIGARQRGLSTILHDAAHGVLTDNKTLRFVLGTVFTGYPIFQQFYAYQKSHVRSHHPYLGDPERDPDLNFYFNQGVYERASPRWYVWRNMILPAIGSRTLAYLKYLIDYRLKRIKLGWGNQEQTKEPKRWERYTFLGFWAVTLSLLFAFGLLTEWVLFWLIPYLTSFQILGWYIELSEHTPYMETETVDLYMARNRKSRGLEKFLTGIHNDHYHLDHHLNPAIPFWNLRKARKIRLQDPEYRRIDEATGGLWTAGPDGAPSAMRRIV
ncbi:MAG: fatty acid desaturase family protein, partial [Acidobacteriota bacterium]